MPQKNFFGIAAVQNADGTYPQAGMTNRIPLSATSLRGLEQKARNWAAGKPCVLLSAPYSRRFEQRAYTKHFLSERP